MKKKPIKSLIDKDGEVREITKTDMLKFTPLKDSFPELAAFAIEQKKRGRPKKIAPKRLISFKLSQDLIKDIRATGKGYSTRVEQALRTALLNGLI